MSDDKYHRWEEYLAALRKPWPNDQCCEPMNREMMERWLADLRAEMSSDVYRQEICAEFINGEVTVPDPGCPDGVRGAAAATDKSVDIRLRATAIDGEFIEDVFISQGVGSLHDSAMAREPTIVLPALTKIKMTCYVPAAKAGADVSGGWSGWIE